MTSSSLFFSLILIVGLPSQGAPTHPSLQKRQMFRSHLQRVCYYRSGRQHHGYRNTEQYRRPFTGATIITSVIDSPSAWGTKLFQESRFGLPPRNARDVGGASRRIMVNNRSARGVATSARFCSVCLLVRLFVCWACLHAFCGVG